MALHDQLIEPARHLAARDVQGRPRQDNLRRAVSTAYYALFHFLVDQATRFLVGATADRAALRGVLGRGFIHADMKKLSTSFAASNLPAKLLPALHGTKIPSDLAIIAETFRTLQEQRHGADYDRLRRFERQDVVVLIDRVDEALRLWGQVQDTPAGRLYMVALLAGERIRE